MHRLTHRCAKRVVEALRKPVLGPIIFGLAFAGIPIGFGFRGRGGDVISPSLLGVMAHLTPAAIILVAVQGIAFGGLSWRRLLRSSFLTSFAACVPGSLGRLHDRGLALRSLGHSWPENFYWTTRVPF